MSPPAKQPNRGDYATDAEYRKAHYRANREAVLARVKAHYNENSARKAISVNNRRNRLNRPHTLQIPNMWEQIQAIYAEARRKTEETGVLHSVDHIWPLNGKYSCGLHVPWNLQVIPQVDNDVKGNKEPHLWWEEIA